LPLLCSEFRDHLKAQAGESDLELRRALRDVADHSTRAVERAQNFRELLVDVMAVNAALVAQKQSAELTALTEASYGQSGQVKRISSWAAILFAPSLIATIYGMNFTHMPQLHWILGYPLALLVMVLLGFGLYTLFKRSGWM
jgi:magnesium transporter